MNEFKKIASKNIAGVLLTVFFNIATSFAMVFAGYSLSFLFKSYENGADRTTELITTCAVVFAIWFIAITLYYVSGVIQANTIRKIKSDLRLMMMDKIASIEYDVFVGKDSGNYISWLSNDVEAITAQSFLSLFSLVTSVSTVLFSAVALFSISVYVGVSAIVLFFFVSVLPQAASKGLKKANKERSQAQENGLERFKDAIMGFSVFYMAQLFGTMKKRIQNASSDLECANYSYSKRCLGINAFIIIMSTFGQIILLTVTVFAAIMGIAPIGAVISVGNLGQSFFSSVGEVAQGFTTLKSSKVLWEKFQIKHKNDVAVNKMNTIGEIELSDVHFSYDEKEILNIDSMSFKGNGKYALVGESGSGKTTLVKLMLGLLKGYTGSITLAGIPLDTIQKDSFYSRIAYVEQKVYLFQDTLRFNITLGENYTEQQILDTIERCRLSSFVASLPNGLDTLISEDGKNMSGGQRQRIALARAMIRNVDFIILDEGTSALDEGNALDIELNLVTDSQLGVIVITHHLRDEVIKYIDSVYELKAAISECDSI